MLAARKAKSHFLLRTYSLLPDVDPDNLCFSSLDFIFPVSLSFPSLYQMAPHAFMYFVLVYSDPGGLELNLSLPSFAPKGCYK